MSARPDSPVEPAQIGSRGSPESSPSAQRRLGDMPVEPRVPLTIVLLAHGPASDTLTAARRLESAVANNSDIVVVEATPPGATAVDRAVARGYGTAPDLVEALHDRPGPLLVVHDDVHIDVSAISAMVEAHVTTGLVSVPISTDHQLTDRPDGPIDLVCAVGSQELLIGLAERAGFGPGMMLDGPFTRVNEARVTHQRTCQTRRIDPKELGRPLLVAALIVRDEEEHLADCLASLTDVVDRIEVVDTGSIDRTTQIAREAGANVTEIAWRHDFAWARNQALEQCSDAANMLWIDADERLTCDDPIEFRELLATYHRVYPSYSLHLRNVNADGTETHSFVTRRLADPSLVRFRGAIHEQAERIDGKPLVTALLNNASIRHLGYDDEVIDLRQKMERNLDIARRGFDANPSETNAVHLARALRGASLDHDDTLRQIVPIRESLTDSSETIRALMHGLEAELLLATDRLEDAIGAARASLDLVPADAIAGAVLAEALRRSNRPDDIVLSATEYASRPSPEPLFVDHLARQTRARIVFEAALRIDDAATALDYAIDVPSELDPWVPLAARVPLEDLIDMAASAATADDERFVRAVIARDELTPAHLAVVADAFSSTNRPGIMTLLTEAHRDLETMGKHVELREAFAATGTSADAIAYARSLCVSHVDLGLELDDADGSADPTALALAVAAEAHVRRGDSDRALADAEESLSLSPAASRAVVIAASAALDNCEPQHALALISAMRKETPLDWLTTSRRHVVATLVARSHLELGSLTDAVREAADVVDDDGFLGIWDQLLDHAGDDLEATTLVLGLALLGDGIEFIDAITTSVPPGRTGQLCATYLALGGRNPDAVTTGILAAVLSGQKELALVIADHGALLPGDIRTRLTEHLLERSVIEVAKRLGGRLSV